MSLVIIPKNIKKEIDSLRRLVPDDCVNRYVDTDGSSYEKVLIIKIYIFLTRIFGWYDRKTIFTNIRTKVFTIKCLMDIGNLDEKVRKEIRKKLRELNIKIISLHTNILTGERFLEVPKATEAINTLHLITHKKSALEIMFNSTG